MQIFAIEYNDYKVFFAGQEKCIHCIRSHEADYGLKPVPSDNFLINMKKDVVITVRVDSEVDEIIRALAQKDDRTVAWVARKLIIEALEARKLLKAKNRT